MSNAILTADAFMAIFGFKRVDLKATPMICKHDLPVSAKCRACFFEAMENEAEMATKGHKPKSRKAKTCRVCKQKFVPRRDMQSCCGWPAPCEAIKAEQNLAKKVAIQEKRDRHDAKRRLTELEPMPKLVKRAQAAFNAFIRARDAGLPCIDCGKPMEPNRPGGSVDAGHYLSRGSAAHLKFHEDNCHAQRKNCNRPGGATRADYRNGLINRIGIERVEALEADQTSRNYTRQDLIDLAAHYRAKTRDLKKGRE